MTEVRNESGRLLGWITQDATAGDTVVLAGVAEWGDPPGDISEVHLPVDLFKVPVVVVTGDRHLSKLRRTSFFEPLATRELMVRAARIAAPQSMYRRGPETPEEEEMFDRIAEKAAKEALAEDVEHRT